MPNYYGQKVDTSRSNGLGVQAAWAKLFDDNERRYAASIMPLSDTAIVTQMKEWFPKRQAVDLMRETKWWRARYNRGILTRGDIPRIKSYHYIVVDTCIIRLKGVGTVVSYKQVKGMLNMEDREKEQQKEQQKEKDANKKVSRQTSRGDTKLVNSRKVVKK